VTTTAAPVPDAHDRVPPLSEAETDMRRHLGFRAAVFRAYEGLFVRGVPVGSLLEETLDVDCASGHLRDPSAPGLYLKAERRLLSVRPWMEAARGQRRAWPPPVPPGRVLIDVASTGHNCRRIWEPIARELGAGRTVLLVPQSAPSADRMPGFEWVSAARLPVSWVEWKAWVRAGYPEWLRRGRGLALVGVSETGVCRLAGTIALQGLRVFQSFAALDHYRPSVVLALADRGASGSALVGAARVHGVPSLTIAHCPVGVTFGATFLPLNADRFLAWGDYQRQALESLGLPADRAAVVGCPGADPQAFREATPPSPDRRRALGIPDLAETVLVLTGPMRDEWRGRWISEVRRAATARPDAAFVLRVHPSEQAGLYTPLVAGLANVAVLENRALSLEESLALARAVIVHGSSVGLDALLAERDLVVLDCLPLTLGTMREVVEAGAAVHARSGADVAAALGDLGDPTRSAAVAARREEGRRFVAGFFAAHGAEAARRTVHEIDRLALRVPVNAC
jgi:hypothetical protein